MARAFAAVAAAAALAAATPALASDAPAAEFTLLEDYTGEKFFRKFDFFDSHDPTDGVQALLQALRHAAWLARYAQVLMTCLRATACVRGGVQAACNFWTRRMPAPLGSLA